jgi:hypothetical protein
MVDKPTETAIFYRTTANGQVEIARISYDQRGLTYEGPEAPAMLQMLLGDLDPVTPNGIRTAIRNAPIRFDGSYLRAAHVTEPS